MCIEPSNALANDMLGVSIYENQQIVYAAQVGSKRTLVVAEVQGRDDDGRLRVMRTDTGNIVRVQPQNVALTF